MSEEKDLYTFMEEKITEGVFGDIKGWAAQKLGRGGGTEIFNKAEWAKIMSPARGAQKLALTLANTPFPHGAKRVRELADIVKAVSALLNAIGGPGETKDPLAIKAQQLIQSMKGSMQKKDWGTLQKTILQLQKEAEQARSPGVRAEEKEIIKEETEVERIARFISEDVNEGRF